MDIEGVLGRLEAAVATLSQLAERNGALGALTMEAAAERLSVSVRTLRRLADRGEVRTVELGRRRLVPLSELARLLEAQPEKDAPRQRGPARRAPSGASEAEAVRSALRRR